MPNNLSDISNQASAPKFSDFDHRMMALALSLAEQGQFSTTPNPMVGCVIVDDTENIIAQGFHRKAGQGHAEVNALQQAGALSRGASAYVTLEPCAHTGRTGPCAVALQQAGIKRVVIACTDPNPLVAGKGIEMLTQAGVEVQWGLLQAPAEQLNRAFFHRLTHNKPFVTVKLAASLDGKTALANGESKWITSPEARADVQLERARACAILTGADTILADDPQLNVRIQELPKHAVEGFLWRQKQPLRVVLDSKNRLTSEYQLIDDEHPALVYNRDFNVSIGQTKTQQVQLNKLSSHGQVDLEAMLHDLAQKEINHLWVEAGASLSGALFDANLVDQLILYQAPKLLGATARGLSNLRSPMDLSQALSGSISKVQTIGPDLKVIIDF